MEDGERESERAEDEERKHTSYPAGRPRAESEGLGLEEQPGGRGGLGRAHGCGRLVI